MDKDQPAAWQVLSWSLQWEDTLHQELLQLIMFT